MNKRALYYMIIVLLFISCSNENKNSKSADSTSNIDISSSSEKTVDPSIDINFPIVGFDPLNVGFEKSTSRRGISDGPLVEGAVFKVNFSMQNSTPNKIIEFKLEKFIMIKFKDKDFGIYPRQTMSLETDINLYEERNWEQNTRGNEINVKTPWLPKEERSFSLKVFGSDVYYPDQFGKYIFERTPDEVDFVIRYEARGVDGEYKNIIRYNIIDKWKEYQSKIGLR